MFKALIFDYFGVVSSDEFWQEVTAEHALSETRRAELLRMGEQVNTGVMRWAEFAALVAGETGRDLQDVLRAYERQRLNLPLLARIQDWRHGRKTALLTNAHHEYLRPILHENGLDRLFDHVFVSSLIGFAKPQPQIYQHALAALGVEPGDCLFVDDSPANVAGAEAAGMRAVLYTGLDELERLLASDR